VEVFYSRWVSDGSLTTSGNEDYLINNDMKTSFSIKGVQGSRNGIDHVTGLLKEGMIKLEEFN
jgi:hypothetical protein